MAKVSENIFVRLNVKAESDIEFKATEHSFSVRIEVNGMVIRMDCPTRDVWFFDGNWERSGYDYTVDEMFDLLKGDNGKIAFTAF